MTTGGSSVAACWISASAVYRPAGPEPTTATSSVFIPADSVPGASTPRSGLLFVRKLGRPAGYCLGDRPGEMLRAQALVLKQLGALAVLQELLCQPEGLDRCFHVLVAQHPADGVTEAAGDAVVLHGDDQPVPGRCRRDRRVDRLDPARVDDGHADALVGRRPPGPRVGPACPSAGR